MAALLLQGNRSRVDEMPRSRTGRLASVRGRVAIRAPLRLRERQRRVIGTRRLPIRGHCRDGRNSAARRCSRLTIAAKISFLADRPGGRPRLTDPDCRRDRETEQPLAGGSGRGADARQHPGDAARFTYQKFRAGCVRLNQTATFAIAVDCETLLAKALSRHAYTDSRGEEARCDGVFGVPGMDSRACLNELADGTVSLHVVPADTLTLARVFYRRPNAVAGVRHLARQHGWHVSHRLRGTDDSTRRSTL